MNVAKTKPAIKRTRFPTGMKVMALTATLISSSVFADMHGDDHAMAASEKTLSVKMQKVDASGTAATIGTVKVHESQYGLVFEPDLTGLTPGLHGFHVHQNPSCKPSTKDGEVTPGGAAGSHLDSKNAEHHDAPWGDGHMGDLPALYVNDQGEAQTPVMAPRLHLSDLKGHALMIHAGGDNYSDNPKPLGGGGARVACGVF